jgi:hypothetical protein
MGNRANVRGVSRWLAALFCIVALSFCVPLLAALAFLWSNGWFGSSDIWPFGYWNVLFTGFLSVGGLMLTKYLRLLPPLVRAVGATLMGTALGFLWTLVVYVMLGPWFGAFSFPVLYCWMFGGALALLFTQLVYAQTWRALH